jgi:spore coat protein H
LQESRHLHRNVKLAGITRQGNCSPFLATRVMRTVLALVCTLPALFASDPPVPEPFRKPSLGHIRITMSPDGAAVLAASPRSSVPATVHWDGKGPYAAKLHLKGGQGSFRPIDDKPSITLTFGSKRLPETPYGLQRVYLNNSVEDPTLLGEDLGGEMFRRAGVAAPHVTWATVDLNGRAMGVYVVLEEAGREFLKREYPPGEGNLYECSSHETAKHHDLGVGLELALDGGLPAQADLRGLGEAVGVKHAKKRWKALAEWVDVERFASFMAVELVIDHFDGYSEAQNNFRLFFDKSSGRAEFIPHGMDRVFTRPDEPLRVKVRGDVAAAFIGTKQGSALLHARLLNLATNVFDPGWMTHRIDTAVAVVGKADPEMPAAAAALKDRVVARAAFLRHWAAESVHAEAGATGGE